MPAILRWVGLVSLAAGMEGMSGIWDSSPATPYRSKVFPRTFRSSREAVVSSPMTLFLMEKNSLLPWEAVRRVKMSRYIIL